MENSKGKTIRITADNKIEILNIPWSLEEWEQSIGAECVEFVHTRIMSDFFKYPIVMIVDESGLVKNRPVNSVASYFYGFWEHGNPIAGDVLLGVQNGPDINPLENAELTKFFIMDQFSVLESIQ